MYRYIYIYFHTYIHIYIYIHRLIHALAHPTTIAPGAAHCLLIEIVYKLFALTARRCWVGE